MAEAKIINTEDLLRNLRVAMKKFHWFNCFN